MSVRPAGPIPARDDGDVVVVGDTDHEAEVSYDLLCRRHWMAGETGRVAPTMAALTDAGVTFDDPELEGALRSVLGR